MSAQTEHALSLGAWLELVMRALPAASAPVSAAEQTAILDLARVAAHPSERIAAPISAYLIGLALATRPAEEREAGLQALVAQLEQQTGA